MISKWPEYIFIDDDSIREVRISNQRRSEDFEVGPPKVSAYSCKTMYQLRFNMSICIENYDEYLDWYERVIRQGTAWFMMKCPIRGKEFRFRFLNDDMQFSKVRDNMRKTCTLERWADV